MNTVPTLTPTTAQTPLNTAANTPTSTPTSSTPGFSLSIPSTSSSARPTKRRPQANSITPLSPSLRHKLDFDFEELERSEAEFAELKKIVHNLKLDDWKYGPKFHALL